MPFQRTCSVLLCIVFTLMARGSDDYLTVAEQSGYTRTATHAEVVELMDRIAAASSIVTRTQLGQSFEGKVLPLAILADPPVTTPAEAHESGKLIVFAFANIHAGEVCGKEALLQLMREVALEPDHPLLDELIIVLAPIYNADGNDRFAAVARNRPGQVGPDEVGQRHNAQDRDLNRDNIKLETPEAQAMARFLNEWDPHLTVDCHTTNGSYHRYTVTYAAPQNPSGATEPIEFVRDQLLPEVTRRLLERTGYDTFFYGNFNRDQTRWATYSHQPRFGCPYRGLRGQMAILSEAYSYAPFEDRVVCTREFVREIMQYAAERRNEMLAIHQRAREDTVARGRNPQPDDVVGIRYAIAPFAEPVTLKGWVMATAENEGGRRGIRARPTDQPHDYTVTHFGRYEATRSVVRPFAYIIPPGHDDIIEKLRQHGVKLEPFVGPVRAEVYTIDEVTAAQRPFEGHVLRTVEATATRAVRTAEAGTHIIHTAQPLGNLIVYMLEPESDDGFAAWDLFGERVGVGNEYPVWRVAHPDDVD